MSETSRGGAIRAAAIGLALVLSTGASLRPAQAASNFPDVPVWANAGAWQDSSIIRDAFGTLVYRNRCIGSFKGPVAETLATRARAITVRFLRDRVSEARPDFGGYRIYRMVNSPDSGQATLVRRFSLNTGSELTWNFSRINPATMSYMCNGSVVNDSIVTFVDPDSNGQYQKICRQRTADGRCIHPGASIFVLVAPPGPHDGFLTWYSITIEKKNTTDPDYEDLFLPDTLDNFARCTDPADRKTCPNLKQAEELGGTSRAHERPDREPRARPGGPESLSGPRGLGPARAGRGALHQPALAIEDQDLHGGRRPGAGNRPQ